MPRAQTRSLQIRIRQGNQRLAQRPESRYCLPMTTTTIIYHMCRSDEWQSALDLGVYSGSSQDKADGFIHFSTSDHVVESAARHRTGQTGLVLLAVDCRSLGERLKWEPARGGILFPHLYADLPVSAVRWVKDLPLGPNGLHLFPDLDS